MRAFHDRSASYQRHNIPHSSAVGVLLAAVTFQERLNAYFIMILFPQYALQWRHSDLVFGVFSWQGLWTARKPRDDDKRSTFCVRTFEYKAEEGEWSASWDSSARRHCPYAYLQQDPLWQQYLGESVLIRVTALKRQGICWQEVHSWVPTRVLPALEILAP